MNDGVIRSLFGAVPTTDAAMRPVGAVSRDAEFRRIEALPRRIKPVADVDGLTHYLRTSDGTMSLRDNQAECLTDLYDFRGLFGMQGTGAGKSIISLLAPMLPHPTDFSRPWVERPMLLVPASLKHKTEAQDIPLYRTHWRMHPNLRVVSNQLLQTLNNKDLLRRYMPDMIVLDEAHEYRNPKAARTKRLLSYLRDYPDTVLVVLSGTLTKRSIRDYWHLLRHALPRQCPLPLQWPTLIEWSEALDEDVPDGRRRTAGALSLFCSTGENTRQGFRRRLTETPGVVATKESSCDASLNILQRPTPVVPAPVVAAFAQMRQTAVTPSGDVLTDRINIWRRCKELSYGFFYRWVWPGPGNDPDVEWLERRKEWRKFVRTTLENNRRGIDSELGVAQACLQGLYDRTVYDAWVAVKGRWNPHPPREAVWVSDYLVRDAAVWLEDEQPGIVWVEHQAVGAKLEQISGKPYFGANDDRIVTYAGPCIASLQAHGKGHNLQRYTRNLMLSCPSGGDTWEQVIARSHRFGQTADEIDIEVYLHCKELRDSFDNARRDARYIQDSTGQEQKLNLATVDVLTPGEIASRIAAADPLWA